MTDELISKTDVVKIVKSVLSPASSLTNVARARRQMLDQIYELESKPEPHWIPVTERLPKEEGFYIVTLEHRYGAETNIRFFKIENGERYWSVWGNENITAWMPKPEPYKGVTE